MKRRKGRSSGRPLDSKHSLHIVLRSTKAKGNWSFRYGRNPQLIQAMVKDLSHKYGIKVLSLANVGNHLHLHIRFAKRYSYVSFIRVLTGNLCRAITGAGRGHPLKQILKARGLDGRFWDYRPFTRIIRGRLGYLRMQDYIEINRWEGQGIGRALSRWRVSFSYFASG